MSLNHDGEQLCGDHVEIVENENSTIVVLADGLGSGVKASILSTLTSTIISTMLAAGLDIRDAVETIADTLPICSERKTAFSTFTIIRLEDDAHADIIQYENPNVILIRNGVQLHEFPLSDDDRSARRRYTAQASSLPTEICSLRSATVCCTQAITVC